MHKLLFSALLMLLSQLNPIICNSYGSPICQAIGSLISSPSRGMVGTTYEGHNNTAGWQWLNQYDFARYQYVPNITQSFYINNTNNYNWTGILVYAYDTVTGIRIGTFNGNYTDTTDMHIIPNCDNYVNDIKQLNKPTQSINTTLTHTYANVRYSGYTFNWTAPITSNNITFRAAIMNGARQLVVINQTMSAYPVTSATPLIPQAYLNQSSASQSKTQSSSAGQDKLFGINNAAVVGLALMYTLL